MSKKHSKRKTPSRCHGMLATKERQRQEGGVVIEPIHERNGTIVYTNRHRAMFTCVLDGYLWHGDIEEPEYEAGMKFQRDYLRSVLKVKIYDSGAGCHGDQQMPAISAINGNQTLRKAFNLLTLAQRGVVISVCVENKRAGTTRRVKYLKLALRVLAKEWKMLVG